MKVKEKEIGFLYNVGAMCDYQDWCVANQKSSIAAAELVKIEYMTRAYAAENGTKDFLTVSDLRKLMPYELEDIIKAAHEAEQAANKRQVETVDSPKKTAEK